MRQATPQKKSNPVIVVGGGIVLLGALYYGLGGDGGPAPTGTTKKTTKKSTAQKPGLFSEADEKAKFPPLTLTVADAFNPLIKKAPRAAVVQTTVNPGGIDPKLTGGDPNWYYTGWVELDGRRQALLENPVSGETEYVSPGEGWKQARVASISVETVVLIGTDGKDYRVKIQEYGVAPGQVPTPEERGVLPLTAPPIAGAIGAPTRSATGSPLAALPTTGTATMTLPDGRTVQVPLDANAAADANAGGNARRRNRRNRNNNTGESNNAP